MTTSYWRLTVEEIAFLMSLRQQPQLAQDLLRTQLGPLTQENVEGRLFAAAHTLIARDELAVAAGGSIHMSERLALLANILLDAPHSLRYMRAYRNAELLLTYHFYGGAIYEHRLEQGLVHEIQVVAGSEAVAAAGVAFFGLNDASAPRFAPVEIAADVWSELSAQQEYPVLAAQARSLGVLNGSAEWLATDLLAAAYRGTVLWVHYNEDKQPVSDQGFLLLHAPERTWLIEPQQAEAGDVVRLQLCNAPLFTAKVQELCQTI